MTAFRRLLAMADRTIDRVHAEKFVFRPRREVVNGGSVNDAGRASVRLVAVYSDAGKRVQMGGAAGAERVTTGPEISFRTTLLGEVRRMDRFERVADGTLFEVTEAVPDGQGRTVACVVEIEG